MNELKKRILESDFYQDIKAKQSSKSVEIYTHSIEAGMEEAASLLDCPLYELAYEIIEYGSAGLFGIAKKSYYVRYIHVPLAKSGSVSSGESDDELDMSISGVGTETRVVDNNIKVRIKTDGVMLRVPKGKSKWTADDVKNILMKKAVINYDKKIVASALEHPTGEYIKIAEAYDNQHGDGQFLVEVSDDKMKVFVKLQPLKDSSKEVGALDIKEQLTQTKVVFGVDDEAIEKLVEDYHVNVPTLVAQGTYVVDGEHARLNYLVNINQRSLPKDSKENVSIDYKDLMNIENVVEEQVLAEKIDGIDGSAGYDVYGNTIEPKPPQDIEIASFCGENTDIASNDKQIIATMDGQVLYINDKFSVSPVYEVAGDVGPQTGNINFVGSVVIKGSVLDNYHVKANGNIDVHGNVGKSFLEADGDIMIKLGMQGHEEGVLKAGGNIISKFIQYATVYAKQNVMVTELIMNSHINADDSILVTGKKAAASGGVLRALNEVNAKILGSVTSVRTIVEVGVLPSERKKVDDLMKEKETLFEEEAVLSKDVKILENQRKAKKLSEDKVEALDEDIQKLEGMRNRLEEIDNELRALNLSMETIVEGANVAVSKELHSGVKISIGAAELESRSSYKDVRFFNLNNNIDTKKYSDKQEVDESQ